MSGIHGTRKKSGAVSSGSLVVFLAAWLMAGGPGWIEGAPLPEYPERAERGAALVAELSGRSFPRAQQTKENAPVFLYLAAHHADEALGLAALDAARLTFTASERQRNTRKLVNTEYAQVVLYYLNHPDPVRQAAGFSAAGNALRMGTPDADVIARIVDMASNHPEPAGRWQALDTLWASETIEQSPEQMTPYLHALNEEPPYIISTALNRLGRFYRSLPEAEQATVRARALLLIEHADPGVRGRAIDLLSTMARGPRVPEEIRNQTLRAVLPRLDDEHPFVQSMACTALGRLEYVPAIPRLMEKVSDLTRNTYDIVGWQELDGSRGRVHHDGSGWSRTGDAALSALQGLSRRVGQRLEYRITAREFDSTFKAAGEAARAWHEEVRDRIPPCAVN